MFWTTTSQLILIGMAAFCISFGFIYTLIYCYKSRRKYQSEENERLRDELLKDKFLTRRRSTSLTSPPFSESVVINPNYNASPYKVPTRHLRSTSENYSPTHYLSPHHRRNSTPTHPSFYPSNKEILRCCLSSSKSILAESAEEISSSSSTTSNSQHCTNSTHITSSSCTSTNLNSTLCNTNKSPSHSPYNHNRTEPYNNYNNNCDCKYKNQNTLILSSQKEKEYSKMNQKSKSIPIPSKLSSSSLSYSSCSPWDNHPNKSFSFGPIPLSRKSRSLRNPNQNDNDTAVEEDEKKPLLHQQKQQCHQKQKQMNSPVEKFVLDNLTSEESVDSVDLDKNSKFLEEKVTSLSLINTKRKTYTPDLFKKEHIVLEEIPYYTDQMSCN